MFPPVGELCLNIWRARNCQESRPSWANQIGTAFFNI
jgi:hypothetical protein